jgi:hypothetical protein
MPIEFGVGVSAQADVLIAGQEAGNQMNEQLGGRKPGLVLVFSSVRFADPRLLRGIRTSVGDCPLAGCTDAGGISNSGPRRRSVTVIGLAGENVEFRVGSSKNISANPETAGTRLTKELMSQLGKKEAKLMLVFPDGLAANNSALLRGICAGAPRLPVVGGSAADDFFFQKTYQYFNDQVLTDSAVAVVMSGDVRWGVGVRHGWMPLGRSRKVTRAQGHVIYQLDRQPAVSIYEDYLGLKKEDLLEDPLAPYSIAYPLGTPLEGHPEFLLRDAIRVGKAGSLVCTGEIQEGKSVRLMIGGYETALEAAQQAAHDAVEQIGRSRLKGALVISSVARQKMLGSEYQGEIDAVRDALGGTAVPMAGFYSYGEFAPLPGSAKKGLGNIFHNESVVVLALG